MAAEPLRLDSFLRVASISVAVYDYLVTLPTELRLYLPNGALKFRWSVSIVLFILIRYVSIISLAVSNFGWFYRNFSTEVCSVYYLAAPALKVAQTIISQAIVGYRTWKISGKSSSVKTILLVFGLVVVIVESYANLHSRIPVQQSGNCSPGNSKTFMPPWVFYFVSMVFDFTALLLSSFFLTRSAGATRGMTLILKMLFYDGLGYVVVLVAVDIMNVILFQDNVDHDTQSSSASFGYMVVWIMSQKFLIHVHDSAEVRLQRNAIFNPTGVGAARSAGTSMIFNENGGKNLDIQVQVKRAVRVDRQPKNSSEPEVFLDQRKGDIENEGPSFAEQVMWEISSIAERVRNSTRPPGEHLYGTGAGGNHRDSMHTPHAY